jgi:hypothetical protein
MTRNRLIHDDRKPYAMYLASQARYADALAQRFGRRDLSWSDRIRTSSPLMVLATPLVSYLIRGGILSGKTGAIYAIDRLIAEAIMFRRMLARAQDNESSPGLASEDPP